jgi:hypothetical protein
MFDQDWNIALSGIDTVAEVVYKRIQIFGITVFPIPYAEEMSSPEECDLILIREPRRPIGRTDLQTGIPCSRCGCYEAEQFVGFGVLAETDNINDDLRAIASYVFGFRSFNRC